MLHACRIRTLSVDGARKSPRKTLDRLLLKQSTRSTSDRENPLVSSRPDFGYDLTMTKTLTYTTSYGQARCGDSADLIENLIDGSINLMMTSPPFPLLRKKEYGNTDQDLYVAWLAGFIRQVMPKIADDGSIVLDLGGAYQRGQPTRSLHIYKLIIELCEVVGLHLCQEFFWYNSAKLPSPIEWVNKRKIRAKDSVNTLLWLSKSPWPKADVCNVLTPYSARMTKMLEGQSQVPKAQLRPSGHVMTDTILRDNGGAIPSNVLTIPNTSSNDSYQRRCKQLGIKAHPARFPAKLPEFFIRMLTDPGDVVLDIFAGSNTTGEVAEILGRRWNTFEQDRDYFATSALRFVHADCCDNELREIHGTLRSGGTMVLSETRKSKAKGRAVRKLLLGDEVALTVFSPAC